jgi:hypothetical protein
MPRIYLPAKFIFDLLHRYSKEAHRVTSGMTPDAVKARWLRLPRELLCQSVQFGALTFAASLRRSSYPSDACRTAPGAWASIRIRRLRACIDRCGARARFPITAAQATTTLTAVARAHLCMQPSVVDVPLPPKRRGDTAGSGSILLASSPSPLSPPVRQARSSSPAILVPAPANYADGAASSRGILKAPGVEGPRGVRKSQPGASTQRARR